MLSYKFDLEKFNRCNDFMLWKVKMNALLVQQGCVGTLEREAKLLKKCNSECKGKYYGESA